MTVLFRPFRNQEQQTGCDNTYKINQAMATSTSFQGLTAAGERYLYRTSSPAGSSTTWTLSCWLKKSEGNIRSWIFGRTVNGTDSETWGINSDGTVRAFNFGGTIYNDIIFSFNGGDNSAWTHIVIAVDTTQAVGADRIKVYANGIRGSVDVTVAQNSISRTLGTLTSAIGSVIGHGVWETRGAMRYADFHMIDGQQLEPTDFGFFSKYDQWVPKKYNGSYGTAGFYLNFADINDLGKDVSGNGIDYTSTSPAPIVVKDTPTDNRPIMDYYNQVNVMTNGRISGRSAASGGCSTVSTHIVDRGKWYCEFKVLNSTGETDYLLFGVGDAVNYTSPQYLGQAATSYGYGGSGKKYNNAVGASYGDSYTTNDIIGIALDMDNHKVWFSKNGVWQAAGDPVAGANPAFNITPTEGYCVGVSWSNPPSLMQAEFFEDDFNYTPPAGFKAITLKNKLAAIGGSPLITDPKEYFDVVTYTGNGTTQDITGLKFKPDLVIIKRSDAAADWKWTDSVRGATKALSCNTTGAETTDAGGLTSFNSDGFTIGNHATYNTSGAQYAAACFRKNPLCGFDIVTYTGTGSSQNIPHNLGAVPSFIIIKSLSNTGNWPIHHKNFNNPVNGIMFLNLTNAETSNASYFSSLPTSSVFTLGNNIDVNASGTQYIAYVFTDVENFQKAAYMAYGSGTAITGLIPLGFKNLSYFGFDLTYSYTGNTMLMSTKATSVNNPHDGPLLLNSNSAKITDAVGFSFFSNKMWQQRPLASNYKTIFFATGTYPEINECAVMATGGT